MLNPRLGYSPFFSESAWQPGTGNCGKRRSGRPWDQLRHTSGRCRNTRAPAARSAVAPLIRRRMLNQRRRAECSRFLTIAVETDIGGERAYKGVNGRETIRVDRALGISWTASGLALLVVRNVIASVQSIFESSPAF